MSETKVVTAVAELHYREDGEKKIVEPGLTKALPAKAAADFLASKAAREPTEDEASLYAHRTGGRKADKAAAEAAAAKEAADKKAADEAAAAEAAKAEAAADKKPAAGKPAAGANPADAIG